MCKNFAKRSSRQNKEAPANVQLGVFGRHRLCCIFSPLTLKTYENGFKTDDSRKTAMRKKSIISFSAGVVF